MRHEFRPLELPEKPAPMRGSGYRVYTSRDEFIVVSAVSAREAIEKSGVPRPYKVELAGVNFKHIIDLSDVEVVKSEETPVASEAETVPENVEPAPEPEANGEEPASE